MPTITASKVFSDEIGQFLPIKVQARTLDKEKFLQFLAEEMKAILTETKLGLT